MRQRRQPYRVKWVRRQAYSRFLRGMPVPMGAQMTVSDEAFTYATLDMPAIIETQLKGQVQREVATWPGARVDYGPVLSERLPIVLARIFVMTATVIRA